MGSFRVSHIWLITVALSVAGFLLGVVSLLLAMAAFRKANALIICRHHRVGRYCVDCALGRD